MATYYAYVIHDPNSGETKAAYMSLDSALAYMDGANGYLRDWTVHEVRFHYYESDKPEAIALIRTLVRVMGKLVLVNTTGYATSELAALDYRESERRAEAETGDVRVLMSSSRLEHSTPDEARISGYEALRRDLEN